MSLYVLENWHLLLYTSTGIAKNSQLSKLGGVQSTDLYITIQITSFPPAPLQLSWAESRPRQDSGHQPLWSVDTRGSQLIPYGMMK
jgi:hypothetical protein